MKESLSTNVCLEEAFLSNYNLSQTCFGCILPINQPGGESKMKFYFTRKVMSPVLEAALESGELMSRVNPLPVSLS